MSGDRGRPAPPGPSPADGDHSPVRVPPGHPGSARAQGATPGPRRLTAWFATRSALAAAVIYLLLACIMVGPGLLPGQTLAGSDSLWTAAPWQGLRPAGVRTLGSNPELNDAVVVFQPFLQYDRASFPRVPLWNPYLMGGRPYVANAQSAVFSPFTLPAEVLPFWRSLAVIAALKLFVAAFGTYLLARRLGMRFGGALLAGVVYAFGLFFVVWLQWPVGSVFALIPLLLTATDRVVWQPGTLSVAGLAVMVALQFFGGHPESSFHALFATVAFFALRLGVANGQRAGGGRAGWRRLVVPTLRFALALVIGTALAAVFLIPFAELVAQSNELAQRSGNHTLAKYLLSVFLPDYWGRPTQTVIEPFLSNRAFYAGALTLILAGAALLLRPTRQRLLIAVFAVFCLALVVGAPPLYGLVTSLPLFHTAQNGRLVILFLLCVALLAGWGLDDLAFRSCWGRRGGILLAGGVVLLLLPALGVAISGRISLADLPQALKVAWAFARPPAAPWGANPGTPAARILPLAAVLEWLVLAGAGVVLVALRLRRRLSPAPFVALAVALVAADLFRAGMGFNTAIPIRDAVQPATGAIHYLQARRPARFVGLPHGPLVPLPPDTAMQFGLYDARGYDYPIDGRYNKLWRTDVAPGPVSFTVPTTEVNLSPAALRVLSLLSVADLIQDPADPPLPPSAGLRLAYDGTDARIYANHRALPRAFLVTHQQVVRGDDAALAAVSAPGFNGRHTAVTEQALPGLAPGTAARDAPTARLLSYASEHVVAQATAARPSLLVLTDIAYPGWQATVDGRPAPIRRVDYLLRGVTVPPGAHRIDFRYAPASWRAGLIISAVGLIALLALLAGGWRTRRRPGASSGWAMTATGHGLRPAARDAPEPRGS